MSHKAKVYWTFAITSVGVFMVTLDNLVVTTALPVIREVVRQGYGNLVAYVERVSGLEAKTFSSIPRAKNAETAFGSSPVTRST